MTEKFDPRVILPRPSPYAAERIQPDIGHWVLYLDQPYKIASTLTFNVPLYPGAKIGLHYALRRDHWPKAQHLIVHADETDQPVEFAA